MYNFSVCQLVIQTGVSFFFSKPLINSKFKTIRYPQGSAAQSAVRAFGIDRKPKSWLDSKVENGKPTVDQGLAA
jgi:hypothetical protein